MMNSISISTLIGEQLEGIHKWNGTLAASNGSLYAIRYMARRVVQFNPVDKSFLTVPWLIVASESIVDDILFVAAMSIIA